MSHSNFDSCQPTRLIGTRIGLTLLELVIVLSILAVLSTVAVRAIDPLADQARYQTTVSTLDQLQRATTGELYARQPSGQPIVSGLIADTGVLPSALSDFTTQPVGIAAYAVQSFDSDRDASNDVTLSSGWNGPYVQLGAGQASLIDGWGQPILVDPDAGTFDFTSYGSDADSALPEDGYQANLVVEIPSSSYTSNLTLRLFDIDGTTGTRIDPSVSAFQQLGVLLYAVNAAGGTTGTIQELLLPVAAIGTFEATQTNIIHGQAAARGIVWNDTNLNQALDLGETIVRKSFVHYFTITSLSDLRIEMELR